MKNLERIVTWLAVAFGLTFFAPGNVLAHCDSLDGPVVKAAQRTLETRDLSGVLMSPRFAPHSTRRSSFVR
jgi:hypothetical protein